MPSDWDGGAPGPTNRHERDPVAAASKAAVWDLVAELEAANKRLREALEGLLYCSCNDNEHENKHLQCRVAIEALAPEAR